METLSKEHIKSRMVKTAARLWNIPENEIENSFDPLVLLLVEACAGEFEKIGFEISRTQQNLLDKFTELLVPQSIACVKPASCIVSAMPLENAAMLNENSIFICTQNIQVRNKPVAKSFHFTPVGKFVIHKAKPVSVFIGERMFSIKENGTKALHHSSSGRGSNNLREIYIALETDVESLTGMNIYFELLNHPHPDNFYNALQHAEIICGNTEIISGSGYYKPGQFDYDIGNVLLRGADDISKINKYVASLYSRKFIHIAKQNGSLQKGIPAELSAAFPPEVLQNAGMNNCVFFKIRFNRNFSEDELEGLNCFINAFPVVNKESCTQNYITDKWINIIPLQTEKYFLDIKDITAADGSRYNHRISPDNDILADGYAAIRKSGISKPDSYAIRNMIAGLINSVQNESSFFTEMNNDFILSRLKEITRMLSGVDEQLSKSSDIKKSSTYILLKPKNEGERITINYYVTEAENAHQILPYSNITPHKHLLANMKDNYIISKVTGGKSVFSDYEKQILLKQQLFSKDRIVSERDIKLLCLQFFSDKLVNIDIKKGYETGHTVHAGLNKTIDINLRLKNIQPDEADYLKNEILLNLQQKATFAYPFRISYHIENA